MKVQFNIDYLSVANMDLFDVKATAKVTVDSSDELVVQAIEIGHTYNTEGVKATPEMLAEIEKDYYFRELAEMEYINQQLRK